MHCEIMHVKWFAKCLALAKVASYLSFVTFMPLVETCHSQNSKRVMARDYVLQILHSYLQKYAPVQIFCLEQRDDVFCSLADGSTTHSENSRKKLLEKDEAKCEASVLGLRASWF